FYEFVMAQFELFNVPPAEICFEITETSAIANLAQASILICKLKAIGCRFSLDDFGSGMSSFAYLKHLPVDYLKIDGGFVKDMVDDPIDCAMVEAINHIGHLMNIETIAEFVENDAILEALRRIGVDYAQGYGVEKPRLGDR
ncbi:MAG TPA: EAL domain-containing protein, partial [Nitrosospira sp.]|nr:EAL domain-containing protein [Nitrosospira sp.]